MISVHLYFVGCHDQTINLLCKLEYYTDGSQTTGVNKAYQHKLCRGQGENIKFFDIDFLMTKNFQTHLVLTRQMRIHRMC